MSDANLNLRNSRILTLDGNSTNGVKYFGMTVKDRYTGTASAEPPNLHQLTMVPTGITTLQNHRFVIASALTGNAVSGATNAIGPTGVTDNVSIVPDLTLDTTRYYQFRAYLTIIIQPLVDNTFLCGHYLITSAVKGTSLIGGNFGYRVDTICTETGMDLYIDENCITLDANTTTANKLTIKITPSANIVFSIDVLSTIDINGAKFSP